MVLGFPHLLLTTVVVVLVVSRCQDLTSRERLSLLMIAPVVIVDHDCLSDLATCLKCVLAHQQRVVMEKLVLCHVTFQPKEMEEILTCLKVNEWLINVSWVGPGL
mgnify:CR=1 FL=1